MMIRPMEDLQSKPDSLAEYCSISGEPVYLTQKGEGKFVLLSLDAYEKQQDMLHLRAKLLDAELEYKHGGRGYTLEEVEAMMGQWKDDEEHEQAA